MTTNAHKSSPIVLVIASLRGGGAERVMTLLANEWVRRGRKVTIITLEDSPDAYQLSSAVERVRLGLSRPSHSKWDALRNNWRRLTALRRAVLSRNPAIVISFMDVTNILTLLATAGSRLPVVVSERIDPRYHSIPAGWQRLRKIVYPRARAVVVQTEAVAEWATEFLRPEQVKVIPNPVSLPPGHGSTAPPDWLPAEYIAAMGRLDDQKGFDLLIKAFSQVAETFPKTSLVIAGEGPERPRLEQLARDLGIEDRVLMPGRVNEPWQLLHHCRAFIMSSRYEGYPNALLEAMAAGAPVISFDCPSGPANLITNKVSGLLVEPENTSALADAIIALLSDENAQKALGAAAKEKAADHSISRIINQWESLFQE